MTTAQEIFNTVLFGLRKQGVRSVNHHGSCRYRGGDEETPLMCAVGMCIRDEEFHPFMEGKSASTLVGGNFKQFIFPERFQPHMRLLDELQAAHDTMVPRYRTDPKYDAYMAAWERRMKTIASMYNLSYDEFDPQAN